jgi:hypothetical protein
MKNWNEVTNPVEIARLAQQLKKRLRLNTDPGGRFRIGYPNGRFEAGVRLAPGNSRERLWVFSGREEKNDDFFTLIGRYTPNQPSPLLIDLQFNFPIRQFGRRKGGAFVKDQSGRVFLAHRGIVTKGNARIKKADLLRHLSWPKVVAVDSDIKPYKLELLLVAELGDNRLVDKIRRFAGAMRDAATMAALQGKQAKGTGKKVAKNRQRETSLDLILSKCRDEFTGTRIVKRTKSVTMKWEHGKVVRALRRALSDSGEKLDCKATDLVIRRRTYIDLFEVKTSSSSQSIYTAIGQLIFNGSLLKRLFPAHSIRRFLVMPASVKHDERQQLCKALGFELITFKQKADNFTFSDLPR